MREAGINGLSGATSASGAAIDGASTTGRSPARIPRITGISPGASVPISSGGGAAAGVGLGAGMGMGAGMAGMIMNSMQPGQQAQPAQPAAAAAAAASAAPAAGTPGVMTLEEAATYLKVAPADIQAAIDAGVPGLHPEIQKLLGRLKFRTSYGQNQLAHAVETAHIAAILAAEVGANVQIAKMGALLHDLSLIHI